MIRIGYHRISDDSVSSSVWVEDDALTTRFLAEIASDSDIDDAWIRYDAAPEFPVMIKENGVALVF